jgi:hypothetical protein
VTPIALPAWRPAGRQVRQGGEDGRVVMDIVQQAYAVARGGAGR